MALTTAFARNGNRKAVPQSTADGSVSYEQGFGNLYALPPEEGGLFIDRAQFNQIMYDTTSAVISNQNSISTLNSKVTANQNSINTLNSKVADLESGISTGVVNLTGNQTIAGVKTFSSPPVSATNPTANNQVANKAYVDTVGNTAVKLTGNQTIAGTKTFSSPVVVPDATATTHAVNLAQLNTKANWNAVVNLTGDQSIAGAKTFTSNITAPNITAMQNNLNTIFSSTSSPVKTETTSKIITVGSDGDFQDLLSAVNEAKKYTSPVEIRLVSNLEVNRSIVINSVNGRHIHINFKNYKITNISSEVAQLSLTLSDIGAFYNLNLENITLSMSCSRTMLADNINININQIGTTYAPIGIVQSSMLNITYGAVLTVNNSDSGLIRSQTGSIISLANVTINSTSNTGDLFEIFNGGILALHDDVIINKPSGLNLYNTAINTPSGNGLILDKTGRS